MRDRVEKVMILPFSVGCVSESSVDVAINHHRRAAKTLQTNPSPLRIPEDEDEVEERLSSTENMKTSFKFLTLSKPEISTGFHRFFKTFKTFSQFFVYKEEMEEDAKREMEIGFPTNVKHVTHIGLDGPVTSNGRWEELITSSSPQLLDFSSVSHH